MQAGGTGGGESEMMEEGGSESEGGGCGLAGSSGARSASSPSPSSSFSISFSRLVKNFTKRNFIFPSHPTPAFARHGTAGLPTPVAVAILMSP